MQIKLFYWCSSWRYVRLKYWLDTEQATSHYLNRYWPTSEMQTGVNRPQCVNTYFLSRTRTQSKMHLCYWYVKITAMLCIEAHRTGRSSPAIAQYTHQWCKFSYLVWRVTIIYESPIMEIKLIFYGIAETHLFLKIYAINAGTVLTRIYISCKACLDGAAVNWYPLLMRKIYQPLWFRGIMWKCRGILTTTPRTEWVIIVTAIVRHLMALH